MASLLIKACQTPWVWRCGWVTKTVDSDHKVAAVIPTEIKVSMEATPWRALRTATRWNGQAAHLDDRQCERGEHPLPSEKRVPGRTANITDRCDSGTNRTAATASRSSRDRAVASSGSARSSDPAERTAAW